MRDTDGDGIPDGHEVKLVQRQLLDTDKDGRPDILDVDDDGDGIPSILEGTGDVDKDGLANYLDTDSDNDGIPDQQEVRLSLKDVDRDRVDDRFDADIHNGKDSNGDGILDQLTFTDSNGNGIADFLDPQNKRIATVSVPVKIAPKPPKQPRNNATKASPISDDTDNDGLKNALELSLGLNPNKADSDGDGLADALELGLNSKQPLDSDLDGRIDALDQDDDNDGIPTNVEIQVSRQQGYKLDTDKDGVFNYLDANDDGDSQLTQLEGPTADKNKNGIPDYLEAADKGSGASASKVVVLYDKSMQRDHLKTDSAVTSSAALATRQ